MMETTRLSSSLLVLAPVQNLEAELQDAKMAMETLGKKNTEEIKCLKEEMNVLLQQRDTLQSQVINWNDNTKNYTII